MTDRDTTARSLRLAEEDAPARPELAAAQGSGPRRGRVPGWLRAHLAVWWPVWVAFAATRVGVIVVGVLSEYAARSRGITDVVPFAEAATYVHYADIVAKGYTLENATQFPLLPALMWGLGTLGIGPQVAALLVVNLAFFVGVLGMAMLGERHVGREASIRAATYLCIWPLSYYFSLGSSESLMLAAMAMAALFAYRATTTGWLVAGVFAALCALSRPPGVLVGLLLLFIAIGQLRSGQLSRRGIAAAIAAGAAIPAAVVAFFGYLQVRTGDFFASTHAQEDFNREMTLDGPLRAVSGAIDSVRSGSLGEGFELAATLLIAVMVTAFAVRAAGERWQVRGWALFGFASLLMPLSTGLVWQMPRFALLIPPLFWMLGVAGRRQWLHMGALLLLPMALAFKVVFEVVGVSR